MTTEPSGPSAEYLNRVPRSPIDDYYIRGEALPESRVGIGVVVSIESDTCTVLINDEEISGVVFLGYPPKVGDIVEVEARGDLLVIPAIASIDTYLEGVSVAEHIVNDENPGLPAGKEVNVAGSMKELPAWEFLTPDNKIWQRDLAESGSGISCYQQQATLQARNLATNPSAELSLSGWEANTAFGAYAPPTFTMSNERAKYGINSVKVAWATNALASSINQSAVTVTTSKTYTASCWVYVPTGSPDVRMGVLFYANGLYTDIKDQWVRISVTWAATTGSAFFNVVTRAPSVGGTCYIDGFMITDTSEPIDYFDGDTPDSGTDLYQWDNAPVQGPSSHYATVPTATLAGKNLITNPSFELGTEGWNSYRANWTRLTSDKQVGSYGLEVKNTGFASFGILVDASAIETGKTYTISAWFKCDTVIGLAFVPTGSFSSTSSRSMGDGTGTWKRHSHTFTATSNGAGLQFLLEFSNTTPGQEAGTLTGYLDAVMLEESATASTYYDGDTPDTSTDAYAWDGSPHLSTTSHYVGVAPVPPVAGAGTLWNSQAFAVEPGEVIDVTAVAQWVRDTPTMQLVVMYGPDVAAMPDPTWADGTPVFPYGDPAAISGTATPTTVAMQATVPADVTITSTSTTFQPRVARIGLKLVGDGTANLTINSVVAMQSASGWPLGSLWMDPDAPAPGIPGTAQVSSGSAIDVPWPGTTGYFPVPGVKKAVVTAPPETGGIAIVMFQYTILMRTANFSILFRPYLNGAATGGYNRAMVTGVNAFLPASSMATVPLAAGETAEIALQYSYPAQMASSSQIYYPSTQVVFLPGGIAASTSTFAGQSSQMSWWDGDSWRPPALRTAAINVDLDSGAATPGKTNTTTAIARSSAKLKLGQSITLTATVSPSAATGTVTFQKAESTSGPWTSLGTATLSGGKAAKALVVKASGNVYFRAVYAGSSLHNGSTSAASAVTRFLVQKPFRVATYPSWVQAYDGAGRKLSGSGHDTSVAQGNKGDGLGDQGSLLRFNLGTVSGEDQVVTKALLYCKVWSHWAYSGGGTLSVGWHTQATLPATWTGGPHMNQSYHEVGTGGWTVNITGWAKSAVLRSDFQGITIGRVTSNSAQYYGYAYPGVAPWMIEVEGTTWV